MVQLIRWFATDIVGVSPSALTDGYRPDWRNDTRVRVIVNGISPFTPEHGPGRLRALVGATDDAVLLCHVGRPSAEKNRVYTVRVLRALRDRGVDAYLALVGGTGPDSADVQAEVRSLDVEAFVHDLGSRRDARILMSEADVMILTSVREGLPGVVLESLSTGTPVVASALPGVEFIAASLRGIRVLGLDEPVSEWARAVQSSIADALQTPLISGLTPIRAWLGGSKSGWKYSWDFFIDELAFTNQQFDVSSLAKTNKKIALFTDNEEDGVAPPGGATPHSTDRP